jgi:hypothetical protein
MGVRLMTEPWSWFASERSADGCPAIGGWFDWAESSTVCLVMTDQPKALRDPRLVAERQSMLHEPHVRDLTRFVDDLRRQRPNCKIPYFDPADGGINARVLFLFEAPGAKATGSGFVSRDNPDETASNVWTMSRSVGLDRTECLLWNACPWYVGTGTKIRAVRVSEVREATESLHALIGHLIQLQCVALVGRKAQQAEAAIAAIRPDVRIVKMFHPSPSFVNRAPGNRELARRGFAEVAGSLVESRASQGLFTDAASESGALTAMTLRLVEENLR